ncbi:high-potential iron-sulfur protein [Halococcus sp. AFM35]|uniref:high-potential iron-sulfur protein n=1 Tax=Halococcus sp. AFM35 TaxID=3421653 RepID=UPI003EBC284D
MGSAAVASLAGCASDDGTGGQGTTTAGNGPATDSSGETTPSEGTTSSGETSETPNTDAAGKRTAEGATANGTPDLSGPVPDTYRTATNQGGTERNPDSLQSKSAVQYQSQPRNNQRCSGCLFYIPDKNGDGLGACSIVEGDIQPNGWCASYSPYQGDQQRR